MIKTILLKTLEAGLNMLVDTGFGEEVRDLKNRLLGKDAQSQRDHTFALAFDAGLKTLPAHTLLDDPKFQEEVVNALLDPLNGFNPQAAAQKFLQAHPDHTLPLKRFFSALENHLLADEYWGELLTRYQEVRLREDVHTALAKRGLPTDERALIQRIMATEGSAVAQGEGAIVLGKNAIFIYGPVQGNVTIGLPGDPTVDAPPPLPNDDEEVE